MKAFPCEARSQEPGAKSQEPCHVVEKFRTHDAVLLGEAHQVREDCELIENLIEPIYRRAGVRLLAMELIKQKRTVELRGLLTAPSYDAARVMQMFQEDYFYWGFQEYEDILRAVWAFNRTLDPATAKGYTDKALRFDATARSVPREARVAAVKPAAAGKSVRMGSFTSWSPTPTIRCRLPGWDSKPVNQPWRYRPRHRQQNPHY